MLNAARLARSQVIPPCFSSTTPLTNQITGKATGSLRFSKAFAGQADRQNDSSDEMENKQQQQKPEKQEQVLPEAEKHRDPMASFGEGYATRSDEEGFGGIYGGNQSLLSEEEEDKIVHGNAPEYGHNQGSEVKEKERARNQADVITSSS